MIGLGIGLPQVAARGRRGFNPASLFATGEVGFWYDPSDLSTMFQDAAGTTPVTAVGQPVGLQLDKSGRGNHRSQSVSLNRPTYARHPLGGIRNLLTYTEQFDNAAWVKDNATVTANAGIAPDGTMTAELATPNGSPIASYAVQNSSAQTGTLSFYAKEGAARYFIAVRGSYVDGDYAVFDLQSGVITQTPTFVGSTASIVSIGSGWYRCILRSSQSTTTNAFSVSGSPTGLLTSASGGLLIWGAQFEPGSTATAYQRVGSAFDVTEAGQPDLYYLSYDGLNDSLSTSAFAWGSDKATVVAGVRKLSDAAYGSIAEFSANVNSNNGAFAIGNGDAASRAWTFIARGTSINAVGSSTAAPDTAVIAGISDISSPLTRIRRNGVAGAVGTASATLGTGNFGTYPVFFGARAGTSLFFNGREYSQFAINRLLTANELSQIELYTAQRTGVTL